MEFSLQSQQGSVVWPGVCAAERLANLEALRALAQGYSVQALAEGVGATPAGFLAHLAGLTEDGADDQGSDPGGQAVTVVTWHRAKGLEWPVDRLLVNSKLKPADLTGVHVVGRADGFDPGEPLVSRWVRYLPHPFGKQEKDVKYLDRLKDTPDYQARLEAAYQEQLRILYVGWTRARDRLVLACREGWLSQGLFSLLRDENNNTLLSEPENDVVRWSGVESRCQVRRLMPIVEKGQSSQPGDDYPLVDGRDYPMASLSPSQMSGTGDVVEQFRIGSRLRLIGQPDMTNLGEAIHTFFAADRPAYPMQERIQLAREALDSWRVPGALDPGELVGAADALQGWLYTRYPDAELRPEWPVMQRLDNGSVVSGYADLVVLTGAGFAVFDYKAFPGGQAEAKEHAASFVGQLNAYAEAIALATGKPCLGRFIHLPVGGFLMRLD